MSVKIHHIKRYKDIAWLLMKYGRRDLVKEAGLEEIVEEANGDAAAALDGQHLAADLEKLGPTFVKLGQLLSTRVDILPLKYVESLTRLQDNVQPFSSELAQKTVEEELGVRLSKAFSSFDLKPIASASLGQVHRAALRDGRAVAVKVQRPGIRHQLVEDLDAMQGVAEFLEKNSEFGSRYEVTTMLREFRKTVVNELDYRQEARNLARLAVNLSEFDRIVIPEPIDDYTTSRVLTMDYVRGKKITAVGPLGRMELGGSELAAQLFRAYLKQILVDGFFHADPHPGNVFVTEDHRLALLDLGMTGHLSPGIQERLLQMLLAISEGRGDEAVNIAIAMGTPRQHFDKTQFYRDTSQLVVRHRDSTVGSLAMGRVLLEFVESSGRCGLRLPSELAMLAKTLLNLDHVARTLNPSFDPNSAIRKNASELMQQRLISNITAGSVMSTVLETRSLVANMPARVNRILESLANNELEIKVDAIDETKLIQGLQKIANRITAGLVLAALIIGAALLFRVPTSFTLLGYPGLAIILFMAAAAGGIGVLLNIYFHDEKPHR